jgi:transcriptional regulator with XRE-family HTH domain
MEMVNMRKDDRAILGKRIKQLRENQGYTPAELAGRLGVTETDVQKIEEGRFPQELLHLLSRLMHLLEHAILKNWRSHRQEFWPEAPALFRDEIRHEHRNPTGY